jgi:integron integrase
MSELDHLKEEVAYLKFWLGIVVVTDISLAGWLISSADTAAPYTDRVIQNAMSQVPDSSAHPVVAADGKEKKLAERFREAIRARHYSRRTEKTYWYWIRYFIFFHGKRHPSQLGGDEVSAFLSWLAIERDVAAATQNQALSALLFLYKHVLGQELPWLKDLIRARRPVRLPTVLTEAEMRRLMDPLQGGARLMVGLLYGAGLRQIECLSLRVKDLDFAYRQIVVRDGKGGKDRVTMLPENLVQPLQQHLGRVRAIHRRDLADGHGEVWLPHALARKYPRAAYEWGGSLSFRRAIARPIRKAALYGAITFIPIPCRASSSARRVSLES